MIPKVRTMLDNIHEFRIAVIKFDNDIDNDPFKAQTLLTFCENANIVSDLIIKTDDFHLHPSCTMTQSYNKRTPYTIYILITKKDPF